MKKLLMALVMGTALLASGICLSAEDKRFAVADGSLTEIVYALHAEKNLLAVDSSSIYPLDAKKLPNMGYMRALSAEGVLSVKPQLLIASSSTGPAPVLAQIQQAGVEVVVVKNDYSVAGLLYKIETLAGLLGKEVQGLQLKTNIHRQLQPLSAVLDGSLAANGKSPTVLFFMNMQGNQLMAAGSGTQADTLVSILHGTNLLGGQVSYKPLAREALLALNPDVIIVASDMHANNANAMLQVFAHTAAYKNQRILVEDTSLLLGFGPRLPEALNKMARVFYPVAFTNAVSL